MSPKFLYPDENSDKILEELDHIVKILQKPKSPELKRNIRVLQSFAKSLFIVSHRKHATTTPQMQTPQPLQPSEPTQPLQVSQPTQPLPKITPQKTPLPPPPPAPITKKPLETPSKEGVPQNISKLKKEDGKITYDLIEPAMEPKDWKIYNKVRIVVKQNIKKDPSVLEKTPFLEKEIKKASKELKIEYSDSYVSKIKYYLEKNIKGYGKMDPLIHDSRVTEITCTSYDNITVTFEGESLPTNIKFDSNEELNNFILGLAEKNDKKVSDTQPELEIKLPNMTIHANYNPITTSSFTIKKTM